LRRSAAAAALSDRPRATLDVVVVELLAPEHAAQGLAHHQASLGRQRARDDEVVEVVGLAEAERHRRVEVPEDDRPEPDASLLSLSLSVVLFAGLSVSG